MAYMQPGIKDLYFSSGLQKFPESFPSANTGDPTKDIYSLGYGEKGTFSISHLNEIKDSNTGRVFPNLLDFKADYQTMQMSLATLKGIMTMAKDSAASVKIATSGLSTVITEGDTTGKLTQVLAAGGLFSFDADKALGLDFELSVTPKDRNLKLTFERGFKYQDGLDLITSSKTATLPFAANRIPYFDKDAVPSGSISPSWASIADNILDDFKISIKTKSTKNEYNKSNITGIEVDLEATQGGVDVDDILNMVKHEFKTADITVNIPLTGGTILVLVFKADGLTKIGKADIGDDKRQSTSIIQGIYDIEFIKSDASSIIFNTYLS